MNRGPGPAPGGDGQGAYVVFLAPCPPEAHPSRTIGRSACPSCADTVPDAPHQPAGIPGRAVSSSTPAPRRRSPVACHGSAGKCRRVRAMGAAAARTQADHLHFSYQSLVMLLTRREFAATPSRESMAPRKIHVVDRAGAKPQPRQKGLEEDLAARLIMEPGTRSSPSSPPLRHGGRPHRPPSPPQTLAAPSSSSRGSTPEPPTGLLDRQGSPRPRRDCPPQRDRRRGRTERRRSSGSAQPTSPNASSTASTSGSETALNRSSKKSAASPASRPPRRST